MARDARLIDGDLLQFNQWLTDDELIVQRIEIRLRTWLGEWILDRFAGMQYETLFRQKPPQVDAFAALIRREIEAVPGVATARVDAAFNTELQRVEVSGRVQIDDTERAIEVRLSPGAGGFEFVGV